jgi:bifunctional UDP-N-acetylglucosamine pyrophosphorylase/glucosamine-1-phosphate N-acetyltransferase
MKSGLADSHASSAAAAPSEGAVRGLAAVVMAAGVGVRMKSKLVKVLHRVAGRPMLLYPLDLAMGLAGEGVTVVVGRQGDEVTAVVEARYAAAGSGGMRGAPVREQGVTACVRPPAGGPPILIARQEAPLGTGHAVRQARETILRARGAGAPRYLILNGDTPLLAEATVRELLARHERSGAAVTVLTAVLDDPSGYGRIVRDGDGRVLRIVEDRDASEAEARIREVNVGTYVVEGAFLFEALDRLEAANAQGEYYLTDVVAQAVARGLRVEALATREPEEGLGINTRRQLARAERVLREQVCARWMDAGVTILDPATTWIGADVAIGPDTVIHPGVTLEGGTVVGEDCELRSHVRIADSRLGNGVAVLDGCVIREAVLEDRTTVGPFAHLRPGTVLRRRAKVGNFVELKQVDLGEGSKANHLSYLGDARIGRDVNIGAGTITCNYDGVRKHVTVIEDGVFVGSDTQLVAPLTVGRNAVVAAGATITADVPADALAIARTPQVNREGWAARHRALLAAPDRAAPSAKQERNSASGRRRAVQAAKGGAPVAKAKRSSAKVGPARKRGRG